MKPYLLFINHAALPAIRGLDEGTRSEILEFLESLKTDPFQEGDFATEHDGRQLQVKVFNLHSILFWSAHAIREVKVIEVFRADI